MKKLVDNWNKLDPFLKEKIGECFVLFLLGLYASYASMVNS